VQIFWAIDHFKIERIVCVGKGAEAEKGNENSEAEEDDQVGPPPGSTGVPMLNIGFHGFHSSYDTSFGSRFMMEGILIPDMVLA